MTGEREFDRIKAGIDDIQKWKAGRTKATIFFNGEHHRLTYAQHKALLLGQKGGLAAGFKAGLEHAAKVAEDHGALVSNEPIGKACARNIAAAIRAEGE